MKYQFNTKEFLIGIGKIFDFSRNLNHPIINFYRNQDISPTEKDAIALESDWKIVGKDLESAIQEFKMIH